MTESERETARALGISINAQVDAGRVIVFQTHVDADIDTVELDKLLDKLNVAADRQSAFYEIPQRKAEAERDEQILYTLKTNVRDMDSKLQLKQEATTGRRSEVKLSAQEQIAKVNAMEGIGRQEEIAKASKQRLEDTTKRAGQRYGTASATDR